MHREYAPVRKYTQVIKIGCPLRCPTILRPTNLPTNKQIPAFVPQRSRDVEESDSL